MVNRIWQHHFGRGIRPTPSEFGTRAEPPTHPELLDWLASEFIARGWSIKQMHKLISSSATYQQSSQTSSEALVRDPENKWFSHQNRVRLEGEAIRDSLLAISGKLNRKVGGLSVFPSDSGGYHENFEELDAERESGRSRATQPLCFRAAESAVPVPGSVRRARQQFELSRAWTQHDRAAVAHVVEFGRSYRRCESHCGPGDEGRELAGGPNRPARFGSCLGAVPPRRNRISRRSSSARATPGVMPLLPNRNSQIANRKWGWKSFVAHCST
jgi:hypothetical protein